RAKSSNADLSALTVDGTSVADFAANTIEYTVNVSNAKTSVTAVGTIAEANASVVVAGGSNLVVGNNTITVTITAQDGTTVKTYTVTVVRAKSSNADLSALTVDGTSVADFAANSIEYTVNVSNAKTSVTAVGTIAEVNASVVVAGGSNLVVGNNTITATVTAQDGTTVKTYTVTVVRARSSNADLSALTVDGTSVTNFAAGTLAYTVNVPNATTSVTAVGTKADATATVAVEGGSNLVVGDNTITVTVTAQDGTTVKTYTVNVVRAKSSNADLSALTVDGTSVANFAAGTLEYTVNIPNATTSVTVTGTTYDTNAKVVVTGGSSLIVGDNTVTVTVTAQDGTTVKTYTVTVVRAKSSNANLSALTVDGTSVANFAAGTLEYTVNVPNATTSVTAVGTKADTAAKVVVTGGSSLVVGDNTVTVTVTAQDGTTSQAYIITINRAASGNAHLSGLTVDGTSVANFAMSTLTYTVNVPNATTSVTVTGVTYDTTATVSAPVVSQLVVGNNVITVTVTAQDGSVNAYRVTIVRAPSNNATLSSLLLSSGSLSPLFTSGVLEYTSSVTNGVSSLTVTANVYDSQASVTANVYNSSHVSVFGPIDLKSGQASAPLPLQVGNNSIKIKVTAQDGTEAIYLLNIYRGEEPSTGPGPITGGPGIPAPPVTPPITEAGVTKYLVDTEKLTKAFGSDQQALATFELHTTDPVVKIEFAASTLLNEASKRPGASVEIKVDGTIYTLPLSIFKNVSKEAIISVTITKVSGQIKEDINKAAAEQGYKQLLNDPIDFLTHIEGKAVIDFNGVYVDRTLTLPSVVDVSKVTGVWVDENNTMHFVPSFISGNTGTITIHSPHNSIYTVIQSDKSFTDLKGHWAKDDVELLANKLIINGTAGNMFEPNNKITRAEFAALLVRSLGLLEEKPGHTFTDVKETDWYAGAVATAQKVGLISGYEDNTFKPNANITREQMVAMIVRAIHVGGKEVKAEGKSLEHFSDGSTIGDWAKEAVAQTVTAKIIEGTTPTTFAAKENATRAQGASMLKRMLQYLAFIN
ncbi:cadherin-like beta sandwich domain-containing protein, partial [Paenibacillus sp. N3.4]|uniref:cadherin-like beta sandwich domain-containing protein n=1 Tax=Paenibacillus sp. N3.4 TaxID=2603222 RepID=UPI0011C78653